MLKWDYIECVNGIKQQWLMLMERIKSLMKQSEHWTILFVKSVLNYIEYEKVIT